MNTHSVSIRSDRVRRSLRERDIEKACSDFLALDSWRMLKTDPVSDRARGKGFGELGMADCLYIRYALAPRAPIRVRDMMGNLSRVEAQVLWIEHKKPGGKASPHQLVWIEAERARGALVWLAGVDFPATVDGFMAHYRASGLLRRNGL